MDGKAHGLMTLVAASAGMIVAFIILGVLILLLLYHRKENEAHVKMIDTKNDVPELVSISVISHENKGFVLNERIEEEEQKRNAF